MAIQNNSSDITRNLRRQASHIAEALARDTEGKAKKLILRGSKSGATYKVPGTQRTYRASAPGEAPAPRTGDLANSIYTLVEGDFKAHVGSGLKYSRLEFGYGHAAPRPYLRPAKDQTMLEAGRIIAAATRGMR